MFHDTVFTSGSLYVNSTRNVNRLDPEYSTFTFHYKGYYCGLKKERNYSLIAFVRWDRSIPRHYRNRVRPDEPAPIRYLGPIRIWPKILILCMFRWIFRVPPKAEVTGSNPVGRATETSSKFQTH